MTTERQLALRDFGRIKNRVLAPERARARGVEKARVATLPLPPAYRLAKRALAACVRKFDPVQYAVAVDAMRALENDTTPATLDRETELEVQMFLARDASLIRLAARVEARRAEWKRS